MSTGIVWSEDEIALLRREWAEGKSAGEIAKLLPGRTRNSVIGRVHRLGLPQRGPLTMRATYHPPKFARPKQRARAVAMPSPPRVQKSLVLSWKSGGPPKPKPPVKIDPNDQAARVAAALLGKAATAERRCESMRAKGVNLSW